MGDLLRCEIRRGLGAHGDDVFSSEQYQTKCSFDFSVFRFLFSVLFAFFILCPDSLGLQLSVFFGVCEDQVQVLVEGNKSADECPRILDSDPNSVVYPLQELAGLA